MGKLFGILHRKETTQSTYYSAANGWWPKRRVLIHIPADVSKKKRDAVAEGLMRWQKILRNPLIGLELAFTDNASDADIRVSFTTDKPRVKKPDGSGEKEVWAKTWTEPTVPSEPKNYAHGYVVFWAGLSDKDQKDSAAHEAGHLWGLTAHSQGGVMDGTIEDGSPGRWDEETLLISYRERKEYGREPA